MQLLISVEPDTRRVPNLPPPVPLSLLLPAPHPSPFGQLDLLPPRLLPPCAGELPSAPFAAGWRRVTSLSKNGRCRLSLSCSGLSFPRPRAHLLLPSVLALSLSLSFSLSRSLLFSLSFWPLSFPLYPFFLSMFSLALSFHLSLSTFLHLRSFPPSRFRSQTLSPRSSLSPSLCRAGEDPLTLSPAASRESVGPLSSPRLSLQRLPLWLAHLPCRGVALIGVSMAEGAGSGAGDEGRGQPGAFSRLGRVRRLVRGERRVRERNKISEEGGGWWRRISSRVGRWKREDEAAGEHRVRGRKGQGDETKARKRTRTKERERLCGGIPSLPGHPRQLPHFPFSSRVCPMLLRFRVGSGPTEPPSVPLLRAALPLYPPPHPLLHPHRPCNGDSHHPAHAGLARWRCVVVMCTRTTRVHVHAGTHVQPDRCLNPHTPPSQIPPLRLLSFSGFPIPFGP